MIPVKIPGTIQFAELRKKDGKADNRRKPLGWALAAWRHIVCNLACVRRLIFCAIALFLFVAFALNAAVAQNQNLPPSDQQRLKSLQKQLELYQAALKKHQSDEFFRNNRQDAVDIESAGLNWLEDYSKNRAIGDLFTVGESGISTLAKQRMEESLNIKSMPPERAERAKKLVEQVVDQRYTRPVSIFGKVYSDGKLISEIKEQYAKGTLHGENLDAAILAVKTFKEGFPQGLGGLGMIPGGAVGNKGIEAANASMEIVGGTLLSGLYLVKASEAKNDIQKSEARSEALKEVVDVTSKSLVTVGGSGLATLAAEAKLAYIDADVVSRLAYWGGSQYVAGHLRAEADKLNSDAITLLNHKIRETQWQIERLQYSKNDGATFQFLEGIGLDTDHNRKKRGEPGGIKLNTVAADQIAAKLDLDAVDYDTASGKIVLEGHASKFSFDLDIFQTVLRLAAEESEPFFGLYPVNYPEWDSMSSWLAEQINSKYGADGYSSLARRLITVGIHLPMQDRPNCYSADLRLLDPALYAQLDEKFDMRAERVYSPAWLRYTKVGDILYRADTDIKAILTGVHRDGDRLQLADVWKINGYRPVAFTTTNRTAGRLNLELDSVQVGATDTRVDLSNVKPALQYYPRKPGTDQDLPRTPDQQRVVDFFAAHWSEFADGVDSFAQLMNIYRAYVAARYLVTKNPGLAKQISDLGDPTDPPGVGTTPAYHVTESAVTGCVAGNRLEPIIPGGRRYFGVGGGASGGTEFLVNKITYTPLGRAEIQSSLSSGALRSEEGIAQEGERTALTLRFDRQSYPLSDQFKLLFAFCALVAAVGGTATALWRKFRGNKGASHICSHCEEIHRRIEWGGFFIDAVTIGSVLFLCGLPFIAAYYSEPPSGVEFLLAVASFVLLSAGLSLLGYVMHMLIALANRARLPALAPTRHLAAGARIFAILLLLILMSGGLNHNDIARRIAYVGGSYGELFLRIIGEPTAILGCLWILLISIGSSFLLRWALPIWLRSNPLPLGLKINHKGSAV